MRYNSLKQKFHTGCSCEQCKNGKNKSVRKTFHRMMRRTYKEQLRDEGEIIDVNKSIGYTD